MESEIQKINMQRMAGKGGQGGGGNRLSNVSGPQTGGGLMSATLAKHPSEGGVEGTGDRPDGVGTVARLEQEMAALSTKNDKLATKCRLLEQELKTALEAADDLQVRAFSLSFFSPRPVYPPVSSCCRPGASQAVQPCG